MSREKKFELIYRTLKEDIRSGIYASGELLPPENQLAADLHVDRSTVRRALQLLVEERYVQKCPGKGSVVLDPSVPKESKPDQPNKNIGFLLPRGNAITEQYYSTLYYVLEAELQKRGYSLIFSTLDIDDNLELVAESLNLDGIVFVSCPPEKFFEQRSKPKLPCVLINSFSPQMPSILSDNKKGAYLAGQHLAEMGHTNILALSGIRSHISNLERLQGFQLAMKDHHIPFDASHILVADSWEWESGMKCMTDYLQKASCLPTAIFGCNDRLAYGAMQAIHKMGLRVPEDISLVGYDNLQSMHISLMKLTTIETHVHLLAESAAAHLFWQLNGGLCLPVRITVPVELVEGETVRKL